MPSRPNTPARDDEMETLAQRLYNGLVGGNLSAIDEWLYVIALNEESPELHDQYLDKLFDHKKYQGREKK